MDSFSNIIKRNISLFPLRHLKNFEESQYLPYFFIVFLDVILGYIEVFSNWFVHLSSDSIKLNRLRNNTANICESFRFLFWRITSFNFCWNSMNTLNNIDHIFEGIFDIFFEIIIIGIKCHLLLSEANVEKTSLALFFHLIKKKSHRVVIDADQGFDHHIIDKFDKISQSLFVSISNL